jgi:putative effector of murein hydrolase
VAIVGSLLLSSISLQVFEWINPDVGRVMAVRSTTIPIALAVAKPFGTPADFVVLATIVSALTGLIGGPALLAWAGLGRGNPESGIALGCASHALGTARALRRGKQRAHLPRSQWACQRSPTG